MDGIDVLCLHRSLVIVDIMGRKKMFCGNCGTEIKMDVLFCPNCGGKIAETTDDLMNQGKVVQKIEDVVVETDDDETVIIPEEQQYIPISSVLEPQTIQNKVTGERKFCANCGTQNGGEDIFCQNCGTRMDEGAPMMQNQPRFQKMKRRGSLLLAGGAAVLLAVVIIRMLVGGSTDGKKEQELIYLKDNSIMTAAPNKYEPTEICDRLLEGADEEYYFLGLNSSYFVPVQYTEDRKYMFYMKNIGDDGYSVYYRKMGARKSEDGKLDSDILQHYVISEDKIVYIKDSQEGKLYVGGIDRKEKVASGVREFVVSSDNKYIFWQEEDGDEYKLYVQDTDLKSDRIKIDTATRVINMSKDLTNIVYMKDDRLWICHNFKDVEKIDSNVSEVYTFNIDEVLEVYYTRYSDEADGSYTLYDLFDDDYATEDAIMREPNIADYQTITYKDSFWGRKETIKTDNAYYDACDAYDAKESRDNLRKQLKLEPVSLKHVSLYYYEDKNKERTELSSFDGEFGGIAPGGSALCYYYEYDMERINKPKLSEYTNDYNAAYSMKESILAGGRRLCCGVGSEIIELTGIDTVTRDGILMYKNQKTDELYIQVSIRQYDKEQGYTEDAKELYTCNYRSGDTACRLLAEDMYQIEGLSEKGIYYSCGADENSATLYLNGEKIDTDVQPHSVVISETETLYLKDVDADRREGTLYSVSNGKSTEIAYDVAAGSYGMVEEDKIAYLVDYNFNRNRGDLKIFSGGKSIVVDTDVACIFFGR